MLTWHSIEMTHCSMGRGYDDSFMWLCNNDTGKTHTCGNLFSEQQKYSTTIIDVIWQCRST